MKNIFSNKYTKIVFLLLAILYALSFAFWKQSRDTFFWANLSEYAAGNNMTILTTMLIHWWKMLFGNEIVYLRLFSRVICIASVMIPYFCLQKRDVWMKNLNYLSMGLVLMGGTIEFIFNDGTTSMFSVVALTTLCLATQLRTKRALAMSIVLSAIAIACRFPNIVLIPFMCFYIYAIDRRAMGRMKLLNKLVVYSIGSFVAYLVLLCVLKQSFDCFGFVHDSTAIATSKVNQSHSLFGLVTLNLYLLLESWVEIAPLLCMSVVAYMFVDFGKLKYAKAALYICLMLGLFYVPARLGFFGANGDHLYLNWRYVALMGMALLVWLCRNTENIKTRYEYGLVFLMAGAVTAGSDAGLMKLIYVFSAFSPLLLCAFVEKTEKPFVVKSMVAASILISVVGFNSELSANRYYADFANNKWQFTTKPEYDESEGCLRDFEEFGVKDHTVFYGAPSHKMYHFTQTAIPYKMNFAQKQEDEAEVDKFIKYLASDEQGVLFFYYSNMEPYIHSRLKEIGFELVSQNDYRYIFKHK